MRDFIVVIPSRLASTRLPDKPLRDIAGRPMIARVCEQALKSRARQVIVATDDERIAGACGGLGVDVEMTSPDHASGTDRIAEVADRFAWDDELIVVNVQGDEPLIPPELVDQAAGLLAENGRAGIATLVTPIRKEDEFFGRHTAKVVTDAQGFALYFSRAPVPAAPDGGVPPEARRHVGLYAYRARSLRNVARAPVCAIERLERLEQLRALWIGERIVVADAVVAPPPGVDTEEDLEHVRAIVAAS